MDSQSQIGEIFVSTCDEKITIKKEFDVAEEVEEAIIDFQIDKSGNNSEEDFGDDEMIFDYKKVSNVNEKSNDDHVVDKQEKVCEAVKQKKWKKRPNVTQSNRSQVFPDNKETKVVSEDVMSTSREQNAQDSFKELTSDCVFSFRGLSPKNEETVSKRRMTKKSPFEDGNVIGTDTSKDATTKAAKFATSTSKTYFICDICNKSLKKKNNLIEHIQKHLSLYRCTYCSFKTNQKQSLRTHVSVTHNKVTVSNCPYCDYKSHNKINLLKHINGKHIKDTVFNCTYCSYKTYYECSLKKHINVKHTKKKVYNCSYCCYKTYRKDSLTVHINTNHNHDSIVYKCSYCNYKSYYKANFNKHVNSQHTKSIVYNCSYCNYKVYDKSSLHKHVNTQHTKKTLYTCSDCSYDTFNQSALYKHINTKHA